MCALHAIPDECVRGYTDSFILFLHWYFGTLVHMADDPKLEIERVQTGVRMEKRILKVLKAFAFDGKTPFSPGSLEKIRDLKKFYELDLDSSASHRLKEIKAKSSRRRRENS